VDPVQWRVMVLAVLTTGFLYSSIRGSKKNCLVTGLVLPAYIATRIDCMILRVFG
jgi:hypothetical protein